MYVFQLGRFDFTELIAVIQSILSTLDHHVLIPGKHPSFAITKTRDESHIIPGDQKRYVFPAADVVMLDLPSITAEWLARSLFATFVEGFGLPARVRRVEVGLEEGPGQGGWVGCL